MATPTPTADDAPPVNPTTRVYDYNVSGQLIYEGWATPGMATSAPVWAIRRYTWTSNNLAREDWADGNSNQDNVWDNRASLTYA